VVPNFVVQAGNPATKTKGADAPEEGTGGSGKTIPFEQSKLPNVRGSLAMALRSPQSDTADSQFFINLKYNNTLDNDYCVFGKVIEGMDVVAKVSKGDVIKSFTPR
jgi:cyclophilin family peptidyl-prolyl cis-trans isomerase